ncbi:hypothetical protein Ae201684_002027 [Aphanomyces euteiches]|uniref:Uncharacterized protein n=1 Tax=Aphanomyces euteiches TaxID=100861 RepID=A0A6G0XRT6_9STRA|nr:hypothetical protein Ae201684_002027 [Aphanomyces euteiches]
MVLREVIWDIVTWLSGLPDKSLASGWMVVGELLSNSELLPFSHKFQPLTISCPTSSITKYRRRILQRLLVLSAAWNPSEVPVVLIVLGMMRFPPAAESSRMPQFYMELALQPDEKVAILTYEIDQCGCCELLGRVIVMQMLSLAKPAQRNRFRHPILTALKPQKNDEKWNWENPQAPASESPPNAQVQLIVLTSLVMGTIVTNDFKSFKKDWMYYSKEILRIAPDDEMSVANTLWIIITSVRSMLSLTSTVLVTYNELLLLMMKKSTLNPDAIEFALQCLLQVSKELVKSHFDATNMDDMVACVKNILGTGFESVLQACLKKELPNSVLSMAVSILACLCPHSPQPVQSFHTMNEDNEFDDPDEWALLASLDVVEGNVVKLPYHHALSASAEIVFKLLRVCLQKLALLQYASTEALTAIGVLLSYISVFNWDILQASSKGPAVFVFPRVLAVAISNSPTNYLASFLQTHGKGEQALIEVWLLTFLDASGDYWLALTPHLAHLPPSSPFHPFLDGCFPSSMSNLSIEDRVKTFERFCLNVRTHLSSSGENTNAIRTTLLDKNTGIFARWIDACSASLLHMTKSASPQRKYVDILNINTENFRSHTSHVVSILMKSKPNATVSVVLYIRMMYTYLATLLSSWGVLVRGTQLMFATFIQEFFPCATFAMHSQAAESLYESQLIFRTKPTAKAQWFGSKLDKSWISFLEFLRSFFSIQNTPALFDWLVQTSEVYQLYTGGFLSSPLRIFVVNLLDPEGSLGLSSYYPIIDSKEALSPVKRDSDYVACALLNCKDHQGASEEKSAFRQFFLFNVIPQHIMSLQSLDAMCPVLQVLRACAHHTTECMNSFDPLEYIVALQSCVEILVCDFDCDLSASKCVLHVELIYWVEKCLRANESLCDSLFSLVGRLILLRSIALRSVLEPGKFVVSNEHQQEFRACQHSLVKEYGFNFGKSFGEASVPVGLNLFRARGDLLVAIQCLMQCTRTSGDMNLRSLTPSEN